MMLSSMSFLRTKKNTVVNLYFTEPSTVLMYLPTYRFLQLMSLGYTHVDAVAVGGAGGAGGGNIFSGKVSGGGGGGGGGVASRRYALADLVTTDIVTYAVGKGGAAGSPASIDGYAPKGADGGVSYIWFFEADIHVGYGGKGGTGGRIQSNVAYASPGGLGGLGKTNTHTSTRSGLNGLWTATGPVGEYTREGVGTGGTGGSGQYSGNQTPTSGGWGSYSDDDLIEAFISGKPGARTNVYNGGSGGGFNRMTWSDYFVAEYRGTAGAMSSGELSSPNGFVGFVFIS